MLVVALARPAPACWARLRLRWGVMLFLQTPNPELIAPETRRFDRLHNRGGLTTVP